MTIEISDKAGEVLANRAAAEGTTVSEVVERLVDSGADPWSQDRLNRQRAAFAEMRAIRESVKPDPNGQTSRDYRDEGRR